MTVWIGGSFEDRNGTSLCDVVANGQLVATFEPQTGGPYALNGRDNSLRMMASSTASAAARGFEWCFAPGRTLLTAIVAAGVFTMALWLAFSSRFVSSSPRMRGFRPTLFERAVSFVTVVGLLVGSTSTNVYATTTSPMFFYYCTDHLGSTKVTTDRTGTTVFQHIEYRGFGSKYVDEQFLVNNVTVVTSEQYTGQTSDDDTGLYYYHARYYDPELARFTQADPSAPPVSSTQSLNRYSYCQNNPISNTDPTGLESISGSSFTFSFISPSYNSWGQSSWTSSWDLNAGWGAGWGISSSSSSEDMGFGAQRLGGQSSYDPFEFAGLSSLSPNGLLERIANPTVSTLEQQVIGPMFADHPTSEGASWVDVGNAALNACMFMPGPIGAAANMIQAAKDFGEGHSAAAAIGVAAAALSIVGMAGEARMVESAAAVSSEARIMGAAESGGIRLSQKGLDLVESHVGQFGNDAANSGMLQRLNDAFAAGQKVTGADANFYLHEASEATMMGRGMSYDAAHAAAIEKYGVSPFSIYHPKVIQANPGLFNNAWRNYWNLPTKP